MNDDSNHSPPDIEDQPHGAAEEPRSALSPLRIEFNVQHSLEFIDTEALRAGITMVAHDYGVERGSISVAIVDDENMHRLNVQFLQHDFTTDVLSFVYASDDDSIEGELILCADYAQRASVDAGWEPATELLLYAVHGMLHLMGLDDTNDQLKQEMRDAERDVLQRLGVQGADGHGLAAIDPSVSD